LLLLKPGFFIRRAARECGANYNDFLLAVLGNRLAADFSLLFPAAALSSPTRFFPAVGRNPAFMEDVMKGSLTLLSLVLVGAVFVAMPASANPAAADNKAAQTAKKETKWQGHVVRIYKDESQMDIRGGVTGQSEDLRKIAYDSSTAWTKLGKPGQQDEVKEGSFVIVLGHVDDKGTLHATRIDLRLPR
jgi:hypothetical protein